MPQIEVTFDIDANGIVNVSAKDKGTGKEQQIRIQASGGLGEDDIERMVAEAEQHADEDRQRREIVDKRNHADGLIHATEKSLGEFGDKISDIDKNEIETAITSLREAMDGEDPAPIQTGIDKLQEVSMKLGEAMYKEQAEAGGAAGNGAEGAAGETDAGSDETVVDADFEEVKDDDQAAR